MPSLIAVIDATRAETGARKFQDAVNRMGGSARAARTDMTGFGAAVDKTAAGSTGAAKKVLALAGAFAGFAAVRGAIKLLIEFEKTMAIVANVQGIDRASRAFEKLEATARNLGARTSFTAKEAAEGLLLLSRAGFSTNEAIAAIPSTLNLAIGGVLELGEASEITANTLRQFSLDAREATRVADALITAANSANTDVRQMAEALKMSGAVAGALGHTVEATAAAIGVLGNSGIQATMAGTALRGVFANLLDSSEKTQGALARLGLTLADVSPATHTLAESMRILRDAGLDVTTAFEIFGNRQAVAALILSRDAEAVEGLTKKIELLKGSAAAAGETVNNTLWGSLKSLVSSLQEATLQAGDAGLAGALRRLSDFSTTVIRDMEGIEKSEDPVVKDWERLIRVAGALVAVRLGVWLASAATGLAAMGSSAVVAGVALGPIVAGALTGVVIYAAFKEEIDGVTRSLKDLAGVKSALPELKDPLAGKDPGAGMHAAYLETQKRIKEMEALDFQREVARLSTIREAEEQRSQEGIARRQAIIDAEVATRTAARDAIAASNAELEREQHLLTLDATQRERAAAIMDVQAAAQAAYATDTETVNRVVAEYVHRLDEVVRLRQFDAERTRRQGEATARLADEQRDQLRIEQRLRDEETRRLETLDETLEGIQRETDLLALSGDERERAAVLLRAQAEAMDEFGNTSEEAAEKISKIEDALEKLDDAKTIRRIADSLGNAFSTALDQLVFDPSGIDWAGLGRGLVNELIFQPLGEQLSDMLFGWLGGNEVDQVDIEAKVVNVNGPGGGGGGAGMTGVHEESTVGGIFDALKEGAQSVWDFFFGDEEAAKTEEEADAATKATERLVGQIQSLGSAATANEAAVKSYNEAVAATSRDGLADPFGPGGPSGTPSMAPWVQGSGGRFSGPAAAPGGYASFAPKARVMANGRPVSVPMPPNPPSIPASQSFIHNPAFRGLPGGAPPAGGTSFGNWFGGRFGGGVNQAWAGMTGEAGNGFWPNVGAFGQGLGQMAGFNGEAFSRAGSGFSTMGQNLFGLAGLGPYGGATAWENLQAAFGAQGAGQALGGTFEALPFPFFGMGTGIGPLGGPGGPGGLAGGGIGPFPGIEGATPFSPPMVSQPIPRIYPPHFGGYSPPIGAEGLSVIPGGPGGLPSTFGPGQWGNDLTMSTSGAQANNSILRMSMMQSALGGAQTPYDLFDPNALLKSRLAGQQYQMGTGAVPPGLAQYLDPSYMGSGGPMGTVGPNWAWLNRFGFGGYPSPIGFANGGVVRSPEYFPAGPGRVGRRGEAGAEGVLPLEQVGGKLGVRAAGMGGGGGLTINYNQTVTTPDADSFRRSRYHHEEDLMRQARRNA
uniref:Putative tail protein n=2 Tax=viral metagenome TaxID=1070528 RepID=A0A6M3JB56_9ZZZZ